MQGDLDPVQSHRLAVLRTFVASRDWLFVGRHGWDFPYRLRGGYGWNYSAVAWAIATIGIKGKEKARRGLTQVDEQMLAMLECPSDHTPAKWHRIGNLKATRKATGTAGE
jgi:hypothetical protein